MSQLDPQQILQMMAKVNERLAVMEQKAALIPGRIAPSGGGGGDGAIWARLTAAEQDDENRRWVYSFVEVHKAEPGFFSPGWSETEGGQTGECRNLMEAMNGTTGMTGIGLTIAEIEEGTCPFELQPIVTGDDGLVVRLWPVSVTGEDEVEWWFSIPNSVKPMG